MHFCNTALQNLPISQVAGTTWDYLPLSQQNLFAIKELVEPRVTEAEAWFWLWQFTAFVLSVVTRSMRILPIFTPMQHVRSAFSMASPERIIETPQIFREKVRP